MWRLIKFLFTGSFHEHKWKIIASGKSYSEFSKSDMPSGNWYDMQCEECGKIKEMRT